MDVSNEKCPAPRLARDRAPPGRMKLQRKSYNPAAACKAAALSVRSQVKPSAEVRPKWP